MILILRIPSIRRWLAIVCDDNFVPAPIDWIAPLSRDEIEQARLREIASLKTLAARSARTPLKLVQR